MEQRQEKSQNGATRGLHDLQFADCNLTGAQLPEGVGKFEFLDVINASTRANRHFFWQLMLACIVIPLALITRQEPKVLNLNIPLEWVAVVGFLFVWYWFFHFQLNLQRHWELLGNLPSRFPDGLSCEKHIHPWFINAFLLKYRTFLKETLPPYYRTQYWLIVLVIWLVAPLALFVIMFLYLYSNRGNELGFISCLFAATCLIVVSCFIAIHFNRQAILTLTKNKDTLTFFHKSLGFNFTHITAWVKRVYGSVRTRFSRLPPP